jgi:hypothetical protein
MRVNGMIKEYNNNLEAPTIYTATTEMATFKTWTKCDVVARVTIPQRSNPTIQADFIVVNNAQMFRTVLGLA